MSRFVTMWCPRCEVDAKREDHPRGGTSWMCPRCYAPLNPLDRHNHRPAGKPGTEGGK